MNSKSKKSYYTVINQLISKISDDICQSEVESTDKKKSLQERLSRIKAIPTHVRTIEINRVACPLHILELTKNLKEISISETLKIIVGGKAVQLELLSACHSLGHKTLVINNAEHRQILVTKRH